MVEQNDSLTKCMNIGGGSFDVGWASSIETSGAKSDGLGLE